VGHSHTFSHSGKDVAIGAIAYILNDVRILILLILAGPALGREERIRRSAVPKEVLAAVARKYPRAKQVGFIREVDKAKVSFEVQIVEGARHIDVDLSRDGKILAEEETITRAALPVAVQEALILRFYDWSVERVERIVKGENAAAPSFELLIAHGSQRSEIVFDRDGRVTHEERKRAD
jgi:hypothetical protein